MQIFTSDFGAIESKKASSKVRRLTRRQFKKRFKKSLADAWESSVMPSLPPTTKKRFSAFL